MREVQETRPKNAKRVYWFSVAVILAVNTLMLVVLIVCHLNATMAAVLVFNILVFGGRAVYALIRRPILFSATNYRRTEAATNAERVGLYAFAVILVAVLIVTFLDDVFSIDDSFSSVDMHLGGLLVLAPMVTYLTSGYGKFRDIVNDQRG